MSLPDCKPYIATLEQAIRLHERARAISKVFPSQETEDQAQAAFYDVENARNELYKQIASTR